MREIRDSAGIKRPIIEDSNSVTLRDWIATCIQGNSLIEYVPERKYSAKELEDEINSLSLVNLPQVGKCISHLINNYCEFGRDNKVVLKFKQKFDSLGYKLPVNLTLELYGDVGMYLGEEAKGTIYLQRGSTEDHVGPNFQGKMYIENGKVGSIAKTCKGEIYHYGTLIYPAKRRVAQNIKKSIGMVP